MLGIVELVEFVDSGDTTWTEMCQLNICIYGTAFIFMKWHETNFEARRAAMTATGRPQ